jgi:hypothetical protein
MAYLALTNGRPRQTQAFLVELEGSIGIPNRPSRRLVHLALGQRMGYPPSRK